MKIELRHGPLDGCSIETDIDVLELLVVTADNSVVLYECDVEGVLNEEVLSRWLTANSDEGHISEFCELFI